MKENLIHKAVEFATKKHAGQVRKGTNIPYIVHPYDVMQLLKQYNCKEEVIVAGLLHDVLEDTNTTKEELEQEFSKEIAQLVQFETEDKTKPYKERKLEHMNQVKNAPLEAKIVNCADKLSNLRCTLIDCTLEGERCFEKFNGTKEDIAWYYGLAIQSLEEVKNTSAKGMYEELIRVYNEVFKKESRV